MSIVISPLSPERLGVTGDIQVELPVPFDAGEDRFHLAFSDGTLIANKYDLEGGRFHFLVEIDGAGFVRIADEQVTLDWRPDWVTIALYRPDAAVRREAGPLPLFEFA